MPSIEEFRTCLLFSPSLSFAVAVVVKDIEFQHRPLLKARVHLLSVKKLVLNRICSNTPSNSNSLFSLLDPILSPLPDHVEFKSFYDGIREHQCSVSSSFISSSRSHTGRFLVIPMGRFHVRPQIRGQTGAWRPHILVGGTGGT